jgi:hypothetical protein
MIKMEKNSLEKAKIRCHCGGNTEKTVIKWRNFPVRAWKCKKCGEEILHPLDAQKALELAKAVKKGELTVKVRRVGRSLTMTIPKKLADIFNLKEGEIAEWAVKGKDEFLVKLQ